jgi:hypothetical protein
VLYGGDYAFQALLWLDNISSNHKNFSGHILPVRSGQPGIISLPETGQKMCYNQYGGIIDCTGTGQDGEIRAGVAWPNPRFIDNEDGTVTDNLTGLMWLKDANCIKTNYPYLSPGDGNGRVRWQSALDFVAGINSGTYIQCGAGYNDWRLPNRKELHSLIDHSGANPALPSGHPFSNVQSYLYWSSTTRVYYPRDAWFVNIVWGGVDYYDKWNYTGYVWPVR